MIDQRRCRWCWGVLTGWLERRQREAIAYLIEEDRLWLLKTPYALRRLRLRAFFGHSQREHRE